MSDFWTKLSVKFYERAKTLQFTNQSLDLLFECLKDDDFVDLGKFDQMEEGQIHELITRLTNHGYYLNGLNLSGSKLSKENILALLGRNIDLKSLNIMRNGITPEDIASKKPVFDVLSHSLLERSLGHQSYDRHDLVPLLDFSQSRTSIIHLAWIGIPDQQFKRDDFYKTAYGARAL